MKRQMLILACLLLASIPVALGEVRLPRVLSDHAVLQRDAPIHIWGWATPAEQVTVVFKGQTRTATTDDLGHWNVYLAPESAGGPYTLTVKASNTITLTDLLVGDVWIASGQSNMELPLNGFPGSAVVNDAANEIAHANIPQMRLLHVPHKTTSYPLQDQPSSWTECTPQTAADFSAVAYFFGREVQQHEHVPIGLIDTTWGGTPAEAWTSLDALSADPGLMPVFRARAEMADEQTDMPAIVDRETREDAAARAANQPAPSHPWHPDPDSWAPAGLFNGMIAPVMGTTIRGVIWYQGEANATHSRASMYSRVFPALIADWRRQWNQGTFPFLFVQISNYAAGAIEDWGTVRDAQRRTLAVNNTAMAVTLDVGDRDNVHPSDKQTVGKRLALAARALAYGENIPYSGPLYRQATPEGSALRVWFTDVSAGLKTKSGAAEGFEIAGDDHHFVPATARIDGDTVVVSSSAVVSPRYVRYGWQNFTHANLENSDGFPASTFTSENF